MQEGHVTKNWILKLPRILLEDDLRLVFTCRLSEDGIKGQLSKMFAAPVPLIPCLTLAHFYYDIKRWLLF